MVISGTASISNNDKTNGPEQTTSYYFGCTS